MEALGFRLRSVLIRVDQKSQTGLLPLCRVSFASCQGQTASHCHQQEQCQTVTTVILACRYLWRNKAHVALLVDS